MKSKFTWIWIAAFVSLPVLAGPTTQPISQKVLVLAFSPIAGSPVNESVSLGVRETLLADLVRLPSLHPITSREVLPNPASGYGTADALRIAEAEHAGWVIHGSYQIIGTELRIIGFAVNTDSGQMVGSLKSTGDLRDLFAMEDSLSHQAQRLLGPPPAMHEKAEDSPGKTEETLYRNFYAWNYADPAVTRSRQTLQTRVDYVDPCFGTFGGCSGYGGYGYGFGYGSFSSGRRLGYYP